MRLVNCPHSSRDFRTSIKIKWVRLSFFPFDGLFLLRYHLVLIFGDIYWCKHEYDSMCLCVCMCVYVHVCTCSLSPLFVYLLYTLLNSLIKRIVSWLPISHLHLNLFAFRGKKLRCPMYCVHFYSVLHLSMFCSFHTCSCGNIYHFSYIHEIVGQNVSFYSVTFSGIQWWKWTQILNEGSDKN